MTTVARPHPAAGINERTFRIRWNIAPLLTLMSSASADQYESGGVDPGDRCAAPRLLRCVSLANHGCTRRSAS